MLPDVPQSGAASLDDRIHNIALDTLGLVGQSRLAGAETVAHTLYGGGLWMGGQQSGTTRVSAARYGTSTYGPCGEEARSVYRLDADSSYASTGWPEDVGAPTDAEGAPRAYGDQMVWMTSCPQPGNPSLFLSPPFEGLRVNTAVIGVDALPHVVLLRYELRNESGASITDAYAGLWADQDLAGLPLDNLLGYVPETGLGYVYLDTTDRNGPRSDSDRGQVAGVLILDAPSDAPTAAYRMVDKGLGLFGEDTIDSVDDYGFALRGLDNDGASMVNPSTEQPTTFAYTGDPVAMTGWLDGFDYCGGGCQEGVQSGEELRQLLSAGPFDLAPGESGVLTIALIAQFGTDLAEGLQFLNEDVARLQATPSLWRFPAES